jgi:hypothetical protein
LKAQGHGGERGRLTHGPRFRRPTFLLCQYHTTGVYQASFPHIPRQASIAMVHAVSKCSSIAYNLIAQNLRKKQRTFGATAADCIDDDYNYVYVAPYILPLILLSGSFLEYYPQSSSLLPSFNITPNPPVWLRLYTPQLSIPINLMIYL